MSLETDLNELGDAIKDRLNTRLLPMGAEAVLGEIGDGQEWPHSATGVLKPTVLIIMGAPTEIGYRARGITGVQDDMMQSDIAAMCVTESEASCNALVATVTVTLRGFVPVPGGGQLECLGGVLRPRPLSIYHPSRYAKTVGFGLSIGALVVSSE